MEAVTELMGLQAKESQEMPGSHQKLEDSPHSLQRRYNPVGTMISDFWPPELWDKNFS